MEELKIKLSESDIVEIVKEPISKAIIKSLGYNLDQIDKSMDEYFKKSLFSNKLSQFESSLDWAVEQAFMSGIEKAMEELDFKELIYQKAKILLSEDNFIKELAEKKVRSSLGLRITD